MKDVKKNVNKGDERDEEGFQAGDEEGEKEKKGRNIYQRITKSMEKDEEEEAKTHGPCGGKKATNIRYSAFGTRYSAQKVILGNVGFGPKNTRRIGYPTIRVGP